MQKQYYEQPYRRPRTTQTRNTRKRQNASKSPMYFFIMAKIITVTICTAVAIIAFFIFWQPETSEAAYYPTLAAAPAPQPTIPASQPIAHPSGPSLTSTSRTTLTDTGYLKLVNRNLAVNRSTDYSQMVSAWPTVPVRATDITLHQTALNAIAALLESAHAPFFVTSGYRDATRQHELYESAVNRAYVLPPGHSEHQLGLAADILVMDIPMGQMSGTPEALWLAENAWRYGLILRYPYGTEHITGVAYEPWHFRYVGRIHAWYMTANNMVLEEYLEYLQNNNGFNVILDGVNYYVMYQQPENGRLYVPTYLPFNMSTSNKGGYIITAWR